MSGWSEALKLSRENTVPGKDGMRADGRTQKFEPIQNE
jgi:hypothetical protein